MALQISALGRDVRLGMLYDCRRNMFLEGKICSESIIQSNMITRDNEQSDYDFNTEDSISEKTKFLDIHGSAKMSVFCGTVKCRGSLKYLDDHQQYTRQARVSFKLGCRTHFDELILDNKEFKSKFAFVSSSESKATHVVVGIQYGADAVMIFDQSASNSHNVQLTKAHLQANVMFFMNISRCIEEAHEAYSNLKEIQCTYYGDIELERTPTTFEDAVDVCKSLSARVNKSNTVPMTVWLYPISSLSKQKPSNTIASKDTQVIKEIECKLEQYQYLKRKCNDISKDYGQLYKTNVQLREKLQAIRQSVAKSEQRFKADLRRSVKDLTEITNPKSTLENVVKDHIQFTEEQTGLQEEIVNQQFGATMLDSFERKVKAKCSGNVKPVASELQYSLDVQVPIMNTYDSIISNPTKDRSHSDNVAHRKAYINDLRNTTKAIKSFRKDHSELTDYNFVITINPSMTRNIESPYVRQITQEEKENAMKNIIGDIDTKVSVIRTVNIDESNQNKKSNDERQNIAKPLNINTEMHDKGPENFEGQEDKTVSWNNDMQANQHQNEDQQQQETEELIYRRESECPDIKQHEEVTTRCWFEIIRGEIKDLQRLVRPENNHMAKESLEREIERIRRNIRELKRLELELQKFYKYLCIRERREWKQNYEENLEEIRNEIELQKLDLNKMQMYLLCVII